MAPGTNTSHPPGDQMLELWHVFLENVDPLTKVIHGPSLQSEIQNAIFDLSSVSKSLEALLFAIYSAAVVSLRDHDCERRFGKSRKTLLSRYRVATKVALSRAKFMGSANLVALQALLIHLLSTREAYDSRTLWTLTGVALRIAEGMGLHRDGSFLRLPPFETEIRRRIWWQLKILDGDSAELSGSDKFGAFDADPRNPKLPSNINDDELYPRLTLLPMTTDRATDIIFCALRFELRSYWTTRALKQREQGKDDWFSNSYGSNAVMNERDKAVDEFEKYLESKYIRYCDPSQPIQLMATLVARAAVSTARLVAHHPRRWRSEELIPEIERRYVWDLSIKGLKQYNMIYTNRELERFSWHAAFYFRWPAFIHILDTLRINPLVQESVQVWHLIDEVYESNPEFVTNTRKALFVAVGNLCLKAHDAREAVSAKEGKPIPQIPSYIQTFRKQREAANARRKTREAADQNAKNPIEGLPIVTQSGSTENQSKSNPTTRPQGQPQQLPYLRQTLPPELTDANQPEHPGGNSPLWLSNRSNEQSDALFTFANDNANMDLDMLLSSDASMENPVDDTIDWVKWDALLGDFT